MSPDLAAMRQRLAAPVEWTEHDDYAGEYRATVCGHYCDVSLDGNAWDASVRIDGLGWWDCSDTFATREAAQQWCETTARAIAAPWLQHCAVLEQRVRELEASLAAEREMRAVLVDLQALAAVARGDTAGAAELHRTASLIRWTKGAPTDGR